MTASESTLASAAARGAVVPVSSLDWMRAVHRALRGRYVATVSMAIAVGAIAAAAGWIAAGPLYRSEGMVRIASALPAVIQQTDQNQPIPMFESFIQAQQGIITSRPVLEAAAKNAIWEEQGISEPPSLEELSANLKVEIKPKSENLRISYTSSRAAVASAAVDATISAYQKTFETGHQQVEQQRLQLIEDYRNKLAEQLDLARGPAPATQPSPQESVAATQPALDVPAPTPPPTADIVGMTDQIMRHLLDDRDKSKDDLDRATLVYGENHRIVQRLQLAYEQTQRRVDRYLEDYISFHNAPPAPAAMNRSRAQVTLAGPTTAPSQSEAAPSAPPSIAMQQLQTQLDEVDRRIEIFKTEAAMPKRLEIVSTGDFPVAVPGRQIKFAAALGGMGGTLPIALMALIGLVRRRYHFCAQVTENLGGKMRFIAAVPHLDDKASPRKLHDAANCIHHLRQKLDQRSNAYLITSADWSQGRSSVALSLGLSLTAAGVSTVVVDADLMTRGLSEALKLNFGPGFFETLNDGNLGTALRMSASGLAILPAGNANEADGPTVSAAAVTRLIERLREIFDVILIDAGPVVSRVETIVLAREVDGVLMVINRGQKHDAVTRALAELEEARAKVIGAVFNGVQHRDFYSSIQYRRPASAPPPELHAVCDVLSGCGPLVTAVATSMNKELDLSFAQSPAAVNAGRDGDKNTQAGQGQRKVA